MKIGDQVRVWHASNRWDATIIAKLGSEVLIYQTKGVREPIYFVVELNGSKFKKEFIEGYPFTEYKRPYYNELPKKWFEAALAGED